MTDLSDLTAEDVRRYLRSEGWGEGWTRDHETAEDLRLAKNRRKVLARVARYDERTLAEVVAAVRDMRDEVQAADEARIPALPLDPDVDAAVEALARRHDRSGEAQPIPAAERDELRLSVVVYQDRELGGLWACQVLGGSIEPIVYEVGASGEAARRLAVEKLRGLRDAINDALRLEER